MSYREHALREFKAAGWDFEGDTGPQKWMMDGVLELLDVLSKQGHSGSSAPYMISLFKTLASFEPIGGLKGTDDEWVEVGEGVWQNKRCSIVFKGADGRAYDIDGIVWRDPDGSCFTNRDSRVYVTFPYTPKTEYRDRPQ